jgi:heptosyltransferase-2
MKFLVIRFSSIGDILLCTPVFRLLKQKFPHSEIHFVTKSAFSNLLKGNENINQVFAWENMSDRVELYGNQYDAIIDLHSNLRSLQLKLRFWNVPHLTLKKKNVSKWLFTLTKSNVFKVSHIVDRYIDTLKFYEIKNDFEGLDFVCESESKNIQNLPENYICLALGGTYLTKRIPQEKIIELIDKSPNSKFVLIGGKDEFELGEQIFNQFQDRILNFSGKISIQESAIILKNSKVVVSGDTGMAHLASALGKPIAMVWGNTSLGYGMGPVNRQNVEIQNFEVDNLSCHPCSKLGFNVCPKGHFKCMLRQNMVDVSNFAEKYL